jgi:hypothetical protein
MFGARLLETRRPSDRRTAEPCRRERQHEKLKAVGQHPHRFHDLQRYPVCVCSERGRRDDLLSSRTSHHAECWEFRGQPVRSEPRRSRHRTSRYVLCDGARPAVQCRPCARECPGHGKRSRIYPRPAAKQCHGDPALVRGETAGAPLAGLPAVEANAAGLRERDAAACDSAALLRSTPQRLESPCQAKPDGLHCHRNYRGDSEGRAIGLGALRDRAHEKR